MIERVLVKQVRLVDEEDREGTLAGKLFDVFADGQEHVAGGGAVGDAEAVAEVAVYTLAGEEPSRPPWGAR